MLTWPLSLLFPLAIFFKVTLSDLQFFFIRKFDLSQRFLAVCQETEKMFPILWFPQVGARFPQTCWRHLLFLHITLGQLHPQLLGSIPLPHRPLPPAVLQLLGFSRHFPPNASEFKFLGPAPVILASSATLQHLAGSLECCSPTPLHSRRNHKTLPGPNKSPQKHHPTTDSPC